MSYHNLVPERHKVIKYANHSKHILYLTFTYFLVTIHLALKNDIDIIILTCNMQYTNIQTFDYSIAYTLNSS